SDFRVSNGGAPFAGDGPLFSTISPNGDGARDRAEVTFHLSEPALVRFVVTRTRKEPVPVSTQLRHLDRGRHTLFWAPARHLNPRTYLVRVTVADEAGNSRTLGAARALGGLRRSTPVIRVLGIDAGFGRASYAPGQLAGLSVSSDAPSLSVQLFRAGPEKVHTHADNVMNGVPVSEPLTLRWTRWRRAPHGVRLRIPALTTGFYFAQLTAPDGRVGYAPFVVRPPRLGWHRVAVVLPTYTWQAYNFRDLDGDGWGDTWYAGPPNATVRLGRPFLRRGVPPHYARYDLGFLHWLAWTGKEVDYLADSDFDRVATGAFLARRYDLIVFAGHHEYVTERTFDLVTRYRDLGGNLAFLSANNFFWRVRESDGLLRRAALFRQVGKPESALIGVQYRANDDGRVQRPFVVRNAAAAPWLWADTGLSDGSTFGEPNGGFGIEIDATTRDSPPGTRVLAEIPDLLGPGLTAQMTYYETAAGARVFAAGALDFGGAAIIWPVRRILQNLWDRLSQP
ncbi:MAG: N,N-dimethylformamidase beta subunit family domain-containing protein, partial [Gaiellaceae bacterium]